LDSVDLDDHANIVKELETSLVDLFDHFFVEVEEVDELRYRMHKHLGKDVGIGIKLTKMLQCALVRLDLVDEIAVELRDAELFRLENELGTLDDVLFESVESFIALGKVVAARERDDIKVSETTPLCVAVRLQLIESQLEIGVADVRKGDGTSREGLGLGHSRGRGEEHVDLGGDADDLPRDVTERRPRIKTRRG
jgi:hypothetical protein